jgi:hypothetical protein
MISIFGTINEVAVLGTTCVVMAVYTLWYAVPVSTVSITGKDDLTLKQNIVAVMIPSVSFLILFGLIAYVLSFADVLSMSPLQIGSALALFGVAAQASVYKTQQKLGISFLNNAAFFIVCIISGTVVLQYWPW